MSIRKPMVLVMAGPNGSGKSTITQYFEKVGVCTNADDMVMATGMDNESAALQADESRYHSIEQKEDFTFETVLSSGYKIRLLEKAKAEGYFIKSIEPVRIVRKHKDSLSIFPNAIWSEEDILKLIR